MRLLPFVMPALLLALVGCRGPIASEIDEDGDGSFSDVDCNDADAAVLPGATELCDGVDNDCSGVVDDIAPGVGTMVYADGDGDGYGRDGASYEACDLPVGYATIAGDCDDSAAAVHPDATEADCTDPTDYNCDGSVGYADADADGFAACKDCDDDAAQRSPLGVELCNGADDDCDGAVDEDAADRKTWHQDADADGFGDAGATVEGCSAPQGAVSDATDCDDTQNTIHPNAAETCNEADDNCNGVVDEDATDAATWYADLDQDGHAGTNITAVACAAPDGYKAAADDCDDLSAKAFPGGAEVCDGVDNDCDGGVDVGATDAPTWYVDGDADGFGGSAGAVTACAQPANTVARAGDCDDTRASTHPGATEVCDGRDDDCNGAVDDDAVNQRTWYADVDADGFGDTASQSTGCSAPNGAASVGGDCDDHANTTYPGAAERCDGVDSNCNGAVDDNAVDTKPFFVDQDGDGVGILGATLLACSAPLGFSTGTDDCDDKDATSYPGASELCDHVDNDCDGAVDDSPVDERTTYVDGDGDGYGDASQVLVTCFLQPGYSAELGDCDDANAAAYPGAAPACDLSDLDCDAVPDGDQDMDGYLMETCGGLDCDDTDPDVYPGVNGCTSHGTVPFVKTNTYDTADCTYGGAGKVDWTNLGNMTWKACVSAASHRNAMLVSQVYSTSLGWAAHRYNSQAPLSQWPSPSWADISASHPCIVGRDTRATSSTAPVTQRASYDGFAWAYEDLGSKRYDECQLAASNAGAMIITPALLGLGTGDGYWVNSTHSCNTFEYVSGSGGAYSNENLGWGARSSARPCMIGYPL